MGVSGKFSSLHTKDCTLTFAPKYRRKAFCKEMESGVAKAILRRCAWKGVRLMEAGAYRTCYLLEMLYRLLLFGFKGD